MPNNAKDHAKDVFTYSFSSFADEKKIVTFHYRSVYGPPKVFRT